MFSRFITLLGVLTVGLLLPPLANATTFLDVPTYHQNREAISHLSSRGIISGHPDGTYRPSDPINRAEAIKLLIAARFDQGEIAQSLNWHFSQGHGYASFRDIPINEWFAPYTELAYQNGIVQGYPDGEFKPSNALNFAEGLKIILESSGADVQRVRFQAKPLLYVQSTDWFAQYFGYAYNKNLINRNKFYHPAKPMTRGEFAEVLYRLKQTQANGLTAFTEQQKPTSNEYTITIPRLNIIDVNVSFADPYSNENALAVLKDGLGHYLSAPGDGGKMVLFGHSSGFSWDTSDYKRVLRQMDRLQDGDLIFINFREKGYVYQVSKHEIIPADKLDVVMNDYGYEELAIFTCWPPDDISHRYVIYATLL